MSLSPVFKSLSRHSSVPNPPRPRLACFPTRLILSLALTGLAALLCYNVAGQAPGVPIYKQGRKQSNLDAGLCDGSKQLFSTGTVAKLQVIKQQLKRTSCSLELPPPNRNKLSSRELCSLAREAHMRVGWSYLCDKCDQWHLNLAGGYLLTTNGAVATCYHVVRPGREIKDGCLVAATDGGKLFPVLEVLAANRYSDAAIVRIAGDGFHPLPLQTNVYPGDLAFCYSDPLEERGYFSDGIINRFYQFPGRRAFSAPESSAYAPTRLNVSTDWAPGSSGSAVLDEYGNAIGHVSTISAVADEEESDSTDSRTLGPTMIVFHEAVSAQDVLRLIKQPK